MREHLQDTLHPQGRYPRGNLLQLPSLLHGPSKAGGHGRTRRSVPEENGEVERSERQEGTEGQEAAGGCALTAFTASAAWLFPRAPGAASHTWGAARESI